MATPIKFRGEAFAPGEGHQNLKLWYIRQIYEKVENESFYGPAHSRRGQFRVLTFLDVFRLFRHVPLPTKGFPTKPSLIRS